MKRKIQRTEDNQSGEDCLGMRKFGKQENQTNEHLESIANRQVRRSKMIILESDDDESESGQRIATRKVNLEPDSDIEPDSDRDPDIESDRGCAAALQYSL